MGWDGPYLSDPGCETGRMNDKPFVHHTRFDNAIAEAEPLWQTVAGCALLWAAFLTLCWML